MNEIELRERYQLLCDRMSHILRNDMRFASQWGNLFLPFKEIDKTFMHDFTELESYDTLLNVIAENPDGRFDRVRNAMARARSLECASDDMLSGTIHCNRVAEIRLRLICQTLNVCYPADEDGSYRWAPAFDILDLPCCAEPGKAYDGSVKRADGRWMCPTEGTLDDNVFGRTGLFTFNSKDKATFAARHYSSLFRDWADCELGYRRIEL